MKPPSGGFFMASNEGSGVDFFISFTKQFARAVAGKVSLRAQVKG